MTGAAAGSAQAQETQSGLVLKDQFGNVDGPPRHRGQAVLLIYGKVEGMRRMKTWEESLRDKVPGTLVVLRGLDAREAQGKKTETEVNERLQLNVPRDIAILVDWKGDSRPRVRLTRCQRVGNRPRCPGQIVPHRLGPGHAGGPGASATSPRARPRDRNVSVM